MQDNTREGGEKGPSLTAAGAGGPKLKVWRAQGQKEGRNGPKNGTLSVAVWVPGEKLNGGGRGSARISGGWGGVPGRGRKGAGGGRLCVTRRRLGGSTARCECRGRGSGEGRGGGRQQHVIISSSSISSDSGRGSATTVDTAVVGGGGEGTPAPAPAPARACACTRASARAKPPTRKATAI